MRNPATVAVEAVVRPLARRGLIDGGRGLRTADLAGPRIVTGVARLSQRLADFAMVGAVLGPPALAGLAFAFAYWQIGNTLSLGVSGGTISQVSKRYGAGEFDRVDAAVKQGVVLGMAIALPLTALFVVYPAELVGLLGQDAVTIGYGATYLGVAGFAIGFEFLNKIASRTLVGADDARTPMLIRGTGAVANVLLNAVFIFGLGLGVAGAALGTLLATALVTVAFAWGFLAGRLPVAGEFPVRLSPSGPYVDTSDMRELVQVSVPLMGRRLASSLVVFPLLAIVATFGPVVVAAFEVARQIRYLITAPNWGFSLAASSLVGQSLGEGDGTEARAYGDDILRLAVVVFIAVSLVVLVLARPISGVFVDDPETIDRTVPFVRVAAISAVGFGIDGAATGVLRGSGDTRWPFYGKLLGLYGFVLPIAYASTVTPLGILALYVALLVETAVPAAVTWYRFHSNAWIAIGGGRAPAPTD